MSKQHNLVEALALWAELTNFDEDRKRFTIRDLRTSQMAESIREALELDETNITGFLMLGYFADLFIEQVNFPLTDLLNNRPKVEAFVHKTERLKAILNDKLMLQDLAHFQLTTRQAVRHYRADTDEVMAIIEDRHDISILRRDALKSMKCLKVDYFTQGLPEAEGVRPVFNTEVYQFFNMNSLLQSLCNMPSGVSLNLIRTPDDYQSYFVFAIRNGGHLVTLSDIAPQVHPLSNSMSRRPDKALDKRANQNWFPYNLMGLKYDAEQGTLWVEKQDFGNALIPLNQTAFPLSAINQLQPQEIIWITLMFELIVERFWRRPVEAPHLSYTGEMVKVQDALIKHAGQSSLPVVQYQGISAHPLTVTEVAYPNSDKKKAFGEQGGSHNDWLVDRYQHQINPTVLNLLNHGDVTAVLTKLDDEGAAPTVLPTDEHERNVRHGGINRPKHYTYHSLDPAAFGSEENLLHDRLFLARMNLATEIQRLADIEYEARKDEVKAWFLERVHQNLDVLLSLASQDKVWLQAEGEFNQDQFTTQSRHGHEGVRYQISELVDYEEYRAKGRTTVHSNSISTGYLPKVDRYGCIRTGAASSYFLRIEPQTAADLAMMAGVTVAEMPDVLQHWTATLPYVGNSILDRIDPVAWELECPWITNCRFNVSIWLSKRGLAAVRKQMPTPALAETFKDFSERWTFTDKPKY